MPLLIMTDDGCALCILGNGGSKGQRCIRDGQRRRQRQRQRRDSDRERVDRSNQFVITWVVR